ncbi:hypothetical protein L2E82_33518 [Cichorium intybus]|uniref:Uncharacterized protein n=1 Tax=Cichorium intybus TaxID=13427 RepID=A0ACB9BKB7_CICIN|nr:hypothetical protein L2E82_33518 [Cichorium intybus]
MGVTWWTEAIVKKEGSNYVTVASVFVTSRTTSRRLSKPNREIQVAKSDIVKKVLSWVQFKQHNDLKKTKTDGNKRGKLNISKLEEAKFAATNNYVDCTLILPEGDTTKNLAMYVLSVLGQDYYGVFPLKGKLLNVREASPKKLQENVEIQRIKKISGLQHGKEYDNVKSLRYCHLLMMADHIIVRFSAIYELKS